MQLWASQGNYIISISAGNEGECRQADDKVLSQESVQCPSTSKKRKLLDYEPTSDKEEKVKPQAVLEGRELWECFYRLGTEMIITKSGRYVGNYLTVLLAR